MTIILVCSCESAQTFNGPDAVADYWAHVAEHEARADVGGDAA